MPTQTFDQWSHEVAGRFLQSVVVVDDQAFLGEPVEVVPATVNPPGRQGRSPAGTATAVSKVAVNNEHNLDAKRLIDAFAEKGLVCAVLRPDSHDDEVPRAQVAARRADILVVDWQISRDNGEAATSLITKVLGEDASSPRLRLIAVYTAEPDLAIVAENLRLSLLELGADTPELTEDGCVIRYGHAHITVLGKPRVTAQTARDVSPEQLPDRLISEFVTVTSGLLSNLVVEGLAAIRLNTHRVLARFHGGLDAPYLTHRALCDPPEDADDHLVPLFVSELQSILEEQQGVRLPADQVNGWLDHKVIGGLQLRRRVRARSNVAARTCVLDYLRNGVAGDKAISGSKYLERLIAELRETKSRAALDELTNILSDDGTSGPDDDLSLALLMSVRSRYQLPAPWLTLGTIISVENEGITRYLVCVQPRCDSVRLKSKQSFLFLKMTTANQGASFGFVIEDSGAMLRLNVSLRPQDTSSFTFKPDKSVGSVLAKLADGKWIFSRTDNSHVRWVADLKPEHAQRVAHLYSARLSRIGLTESEWLRRWSLKQNA